MRRVGFALLLVGCSSGNAPDGDTDAPEFGAGTETDASTSNSGSDTASNGSMGTSAATSGPSTTASPTVTASGTAGTTSNDSGTESSGDTPDVGCQNGTIDEGEECDDGNDVNADGCNRDCRLSGQLISVHTHGSGFNQLDQGFAVAPEADGTAIVSGYVSIDAEGARDAWLARYSATGQLMWEQTIAGPGDGNDELRGLVGDGAGQIYAAGYQRGVEGEGLNAIVAKYDLAGNQEWVQIFNGPESMSDVYDVVTLDNAGNVIVGGYSGNAAEGNDVFLRKLSSDGDTLWSRSRSGPNGGTDLIWDVAVSSMGHIYAGGYEDGPVGEARNAWVAKFDTDGNELWSRSFNGADSLGDYINGVTVIGEDDVVVCGYEESTEYPWHSIVRRYDSLGMIVWTDRYDGETSEGAHCFGIMTDGDGNLATTGGEIVSGVRAVVVRKYGPNGTPLWTTQAPGGSVGPDYGRDVAIGPEDSVWIVGSVDTGADLRDVWVGRFSP